MFEFFRRKGKFYGVRVSEDQHEISFQQAPVLWSASQSLLGLLKLGTPDVPWARQIKRLDLEILALFRAVSPHDELATIVLSSIPKEATERGVFPEEALRTRFDEVEKVAKRLDLVPAEGGSLLVHILSYVQSLLLIDSACRISRSELNDEKQDFSKLNTQDILFRAKFWLNRGDFVQALKYMNLLRGAPRSVAKQWMHEVKILLETELAAKILMAYAASSGLRFL